MQGVTFYGAGVGYRPKIHQALMEHRDEIGCLELLVDGFRNAENWRDLLKELAGFTLLPHGTQMSIGTAAPLDRGYLQELCSFLEVVRPPFYTEHLAFTKVPNVNAGHLIPLWYTEEMLEWMIGRVKEVRAALGMPLALENVTYLLKFGQADMSQAEFITRLVEATDVGLLLDVTNVFTNASNHGYDPYAFLDSLPLENVWQLHVAGGYVKGGIWVDSHSEPVPEQVWELLGYLRGRLPGLRGVIIERDRNLEDFGELLSEVRRSKRELGVEEEREGATS